MADVARREARRRRILENSENRLNQITGKSKGNSAEEHNHNATGFLKSQGDNGHISTRSFIAENKSLLEEKHQDFLQRRDDSDIQEFQFAESTVQYEQPDNHFAHENVEHRYSLKENRKTCDNTNSKSIINPSGQILCDEPHNFILSNFILSPLAYIFLAAFVNILFLLNVDFSLYKGILTPYLVLVITQLCLGSKQKESQDNMLVAALILCNIKPEVVHSFKKILKLFSTISKDFALYLTSFILLNWCLSLGKSDLSYIKFF